METKPHETALDKLKDIAGEHFEDYLLVVVKDKQVWSTYKSKCSAYGMASMIKSDIEKEWNSSKD